MKGGIDAREKWGVERRKEGQTEWGKTERERE